jgi:hypothetical protein
MYDLQSPKGFNMNKTKTTNHGNPGGAEYVLVVYDKIFKPFGFPALALFNCKPSFKKIARNIISRAIHMIYFGNS